MNDNLISPGNMAWMAVYGGNGDLSIVTGVRGKVILRWKKSSDILPLETDRREGR